MKCWTQFLQERTHGNTCAGHKTVWYYIESFWVLINQAYTNILESKEKKPTLTAEIIELIKLTLNNDIK